MPAVHLLVNPSRSSRRGLLDRVRSAIESSGREVIELRPANAAAVADTVTRAREGREGGSGGQQPLERLVVAGGDGLIHQALPAVANSGIPVGIIGVGTGNDFARALGLPTRIDAAVRAALGEPSPVDLITTGCGRFAASVVTGGFSGRVNERANSLCFPPGQQRYTVATLLELRHLEPVALQLAVDGETHKLNSSLFAIANTKFFGGGMAISPQAEPTDGLLDVVVVDAISPWLLARMLPTVFSGRHINHPAVSTYRGASIELATEAGLWADGEPFDANVLTIAPGALSLAGSLGFD